MHKSLITAMNILAAGMLLGNALAQQTPAATTPPATQAPAATAPAATSQVAPSPGTPAKAQAPAAAAAKKPATAAKAAVPLTLKTQKEKFSYALGMNTGKRMADSLNKQSVPFDPAILARGMKDALVGGKTLLTDEEAQAVMTEMQKEMQGKMQEKNKEALEANKKDGTAFLAANKGKAGVVVLPSGLQYKILTPGTGPKPATTDSVVCNYRGTLVDGKEFDSSYKRGKPATFPVTGVIKGWTEALQLMPVGSKWQLFIPSDLAYGDRGAGADIGPGSTLIFEIELLSIEDKSKDKAPAAEEKK
jgi:FKBP-type peptidyl-prolyl cis-trans isomerase FklB